MGEQLVCLADCAAKDIFPEIGREAWPPIIFGEEGDGAQLATVAALKGAMGGSDQVMADNFRNVEVGFEVEVPVTDVWDPPPFSPIPSSPLSHSLWDQITNNKGIFLEILDQFVDGNVPRITF